MNFAGFDALVVLFHCDWLLVCCVTWLVALFVCFRVVWVLLVVALCFICCGMVAGVLFTCFRFGVFGFNLFSLMLAGFAC